MREVKRDTEKCQLSPHGAHFYCSNWLGVRVKDQLFTG